MSSEAIRVLIVDDEPIARRGIRQFLATHSDVEVASESGNGTEAVRLIRKLRPDLVLLDVQMPELDGFGVLSQIEPKLLPMVIFITAYDEFAVRAFEAHAVDYLLKPLTEQRFRVALARAREILHSRELLDLSRRLALLVAERNAVPNGGVRRLLIGTVGCHRVVDVDDITWIEADDYYAAVRVRGQRHLLRESLTSLEGRLDRSQFVRTHRGVIVNLGQVAELRRDGGQVMLLLRDGSQLPVSRRRRYSVEVALRKFTG